MVIVVRNRYMIPSVLYLMKSETCLCLQCPVWRS